MKNTIIFLNSLLLLGNSLGSSFKESYAINIPTSLQLTDSGSFEISLTENNLSDNETINISIDNNFTLSDSHGKADIYGSITNNEITFSKQDASAKTVYYEVNDASVGDWQGNLCLNIEVESQTNANIFMSGQSIQRKLVKYKPTKITFSHDVIEGTYLYDLSLDQDESILLYGSNGELTITNMKNEKFKANPNMSSFFKSLTNLTTIENIDYIDMSTCTNMSNMFYLCNSLTSVDLSSFDVSNVTNMTNAFAMMHSCTSLGDISNWDVSNVTSFQKLFYSDYKLSGYGDLGKWRVSNKCTNISYMFALSSYTANSANSSIFPSSLNLNNWDVSNVTNMSYAFKNAFNLQTLDISSWDCSNVSDMSQMFAMQDNSLSSNLNSITGIDNLNISSATKTDMFLGCNNLTLPSWYQ